MGLQVALSYTSVTSVSLYLSSPATGCYSVSVSAYKGDVFEDDMIVLTVQRLSFLLAVGGLVIIKLYYLNVMIQLHNQLHSLLLGALHRTCTKHLGNTWQTCKGCFRSILVMKVADL